MIIEKALIICKDCVFRNFPAEQKNYPGKEFRINWFVIAQSQRHHIFVLQLLNAFAFPQYPIAPGRCSLFFAAVPVIGTRIVAICGTKCDRSLSVATEYALPLHFLMQLVRLQNGTEVVGVEFGSRYTVH